jgi:hypothetical protein
MKRACTSVTELASNDNVGTPHEKIDERIEPVAWRNLDNIAPAGSINASVNDMAQWLRLQLNEGTIDGKRIISAAAIKEMHTPQMVSRSDEITRKLYPDAHFINYGLGWELQDCHGRKIVEHGGAIDGMRAEVGLIPEEKLGVVILCNRGGTAMPIPLMFTVFDRFLGHKGRDRCAEILALVKELEAKEKEKEAKQQAERAKDTRPSLPLEKYAGKFTQDLYGDAEVKLEKDKLVLVRQPAIVADLEHWHYDTFQAKYRDRVIDRQLITFQLDAAGKVKALELPELGAFTRKE